MVIYACPRSQLRYLSMRQGDYQQLECFRDPAGERKVNQSPFHSKLIMGESPRPFVRIQEDG